MFHKWVLGTCKDNSKTPDCGCVACHSHAALSQPGWRGAAEHEAWCHRFGSPAKQRQDEVTWPSKKKKKKKRWHWLSCWCWPDSRHEVAQLEGDRRGLSQVAPGFRHDHSWRRSRCWCSQLNGDWQGCQFFSEGSSYWRLKSFQMTSLCDLLHPSLLFARQKGWDKCLDALFTEWILHSKSYLKIYKY